MALKNRLVAFVAGVLLGPAMVWAGLETGTYISDLVATNPLSSDLASTGDDHIRLLKSTIKATFPNVNGAMTATDEELSLLAGKTGTVWTSANDGSGSGLDADTVDGAAPVTVANPSGTIGLAAVNGSAASAIRSDGAPALSQAIAPTWSGTHTYTANGFTDTTAAIVMSSTSAFMMWKETDAAANNGLWRAYASGEQLVFDVLNDAQNSASNWLTVDRTGTTVDRVHFPRDASSEVFKVGTDQAGDITGVMSYFRTTTASNGAIYAANATAANGTLYVINQATSGDNVFTTFATESTLLGTPRGSIDFDRTGVVTRYNTTSDVRLKNNFKPAPSARGVIDCIKIESYDWRETRSHVDHGVVAQRLDKCAPYAVSKGDTWGVDPSKLVPALIKYVQEQDARIRALEARLN